MSDYFADLLSRALGVPGLYIFIAPPNLEELRRRLVGRKTDAPEVVERRLKKAEDEQHWVKPKLVKKKRAAKKAARKIEQIAF